MRPRKFIVVYSPLEVGAGAQVFALNTRGFHAMAVHTPADLTAELEARTVDAILVWWEPGRHEAARHAERIAADANVPTVSVSRKGEIPNSIAGWVIPKTSNIETFEALRISAARKRGPKRGYRRQPQPTVVSSSDEALSERRYA